MAQPLQMKTLDTRLKLDQEFISEISCYEPIVLEYSEDLISCYDKDGFDLTPLEQLLYRQQGFKLYHILNRDLLALPWVSQFPDDPRLYIDHCVLFMRCDFRGECLRQLNELLNLDPKMWFLINTKRKWGIDIDINWIENGKIYEIIHLEYDSYYLDEAIGIKNSLENYFNAADIPDMADQIIKHEDEWSKCNGIQRNDWKAKFFGFGAAEETLKSF